MACSRTVIQKHLKKRDAPRPDRTGRYNAETVREFIADERKQDCRYNSGDLLKARIAKLLLECQELRARLHLQEPSIPSSQIATMLWAVLNQIHIYLLALTRSAAPHLKNISDEAALIRAWEPRIMETENALCNWIERQQNLPMGKNPFPVVWPLEDGPKYYNWQSWALAAKKFEGERAAIISPPAIAEPGIAEKTADDESAK